MRAGALPHLKLDNEIEGFVQQLRKWMGRIHGLGSDQRKHVLEVVLTKGLLLTRGELLIGLEGDALALQPLEQGEQLNTIEHTPHTPTEANIMNAWAT